MKIIKYIPIILIFLMSTSCSWIDGWTHFEIDYETTVTLPQDLDVNQSEDVYPAQIAADLDKEVEDEGYDPDKIESVVLDKLKLTLEVPAGTDFGFLTSAELFMTAGDHEEIRVAWINDVSDGVGNTIKAKTSSKNLKKYLEEPVITLRLNVIVNEGIPSDYYIGLDMTFIVDVKILGI